MHITETSETILGLVEELEQKRHEARKLLQRSKNRVYKKWKGPKPEQRLASLHKHCPNLQPDNYFRRAESGQSSLNALRSANKSLLRNQFSLDDLKDDWTAFLTLIHSRTEFGSEAWLPCDRESLVKYWTSGLFIVPFSTNCVVLRGPGFGTIISWNPRQIHQRDALPVHYMSLVLQLQKLVTDLVRNGLVDLMKASAGPGKSHLWDQFLHSKSDPTLNDDVQFPLVHAFSMVTCGDHRDDHLTPPNTVGGTRRQTYSITKRLTFLFVESEIPSGLSGKLQANGPPEDHPRGVNKKARVC